MFEQTSKDIDDVLCEAAGCATELDYTEQTSWMLFLKCLDDLEHGRAMEAELVGEDLVDYVNRDRFPYLQGFKHRASGPTVDGA
jgi:type I restriction enzyme M protein